MSEALIIDSLEKLRQFANEKGILEVVQRNRRKQYKPFQNFLIGNLDQTKEQNLVRKAIQVMNRDVRLNMRSLNLLGQVAMVGRIGLVLNGLNLCATCAGFAIMYARLDAMSAEINRQLAQLQKTVHQTHEIRNEYEFNKVLAEHTDMLDSERRLHPYSEEKMRELVDREYNVLMLLVSTFREDVTGDRGDLIFSIFSMLAMFTVSLRNFDELYYFNNRQVLGEKDFWHLGHEKWMGAYDQLSSQWFVEKLQDYGMFDAELTARGTDVYTVSLQDQVKDLREEIEDNQVLLTALKDASLYRQYKEMSAREVADSIEAAFREAGIGMDEAVVTAAYQDAMRQAAMM